MTRGDVVLVTGQSGLAGKPRPCIVVQRSATLAAAGKVTVCPLTSVVRVGLPIRPVVHPSAENGLERISEVQIDWLFTYRTDRIRGTIGRIDATTMLSIDAAMRRWLNL